MSECPTYIKSFHKSTRRIDKNYKQAIPRRKQEKWLIPTYPCKKHRKNVKNKIEKSEETFLWGKLLLPTMHFPPLPGNSFSFSHLRSKQNPHSSPLFHQYILCTYVLWPLGHWIQCLLTGLLSFADRQLHPSLCLSD